MHQNWHKPYKFLLIGCDSIAHSYATALHSHPDMELTAVVDQNLEAARAFGTSFNCSCYTSLEDYVRANHFADCGIICRSAFNQSDIANRLMQLGTSILCEAPFAPDSASAEKMIDVSRTFGVQLMMGSRFRYITDIIHAKGLVQSGILGEILVFEIDFRDMVDAGFQQRPHPDTGNHGVLMDSGIHAVDIARYFFGPLLRIRVEEAQCLHSQAAENTARLDMRTVLGVIGTAQLSWSIKNACEDYVRIYGTRGTLCIGWKNSMYRLNGSVDWIKFGEGYSTLKAITRQIENLLDTVTGDGTAETTAEDGRASVRAIEAAYQSLKTGNWTMLQPGVSAASQPRFERNFTVLRPRKLSSNA